MAGVALLPLPTDGQIKKGLGLSWVMGREVDHVGKNPLAGVVRGSRHTRAEP